MANILWKKIEIPAEQRKKTTLASNLYYDTLELYTDKIIGFLNGKQKMTWRFSEYSGIDCIKANLNSQFGQIVFLTGINSRNRVVGLDFGSKQNISAMNDTNRVLFCSGMFSFGNTNSFTEYVADEIRTVFESFKDSANSSNASQPLSQADELAKFKGLLDSGILTQEEFDTKKKQLLGL